MVNLENVLFLEDRIWLISEKIKNSHSVLDLCEDWWELLRHESVLFEVEKIFKDEVLRKNIRKQFIL